MDLQGDNQSSDESLIWWRHSLKLISGFLAVDTWNTSSYLQLSIVLTSLLFHFFLCFQNTYEYALFWVFLWCTNIFIDEVELSITILIGLLLSKKSGTFKDCIQNHTSRKLFCDIGPYWCCYFLSTLVNHSKYVLILSYVCAKISSEVFEIHVD